MFYIWFEVYVVYNLILQSEYSTIYFPNKCERRSENIPNNKSFIGLGREKPVILLLSHHGNKADQGNSALLVPLINFFLRKMIIMR